MANISKNLTIDLTTKRIVRENNPLIGQRVYTFSEGSTYAGTISLFQAGFSVDPNLISSVTIEVGNTTNDIALVRFDGEDENFALSFNGDLLRQYLYSSDTKQAVFNVTLTVSGSVYVLESVACVLIPNPDDNTGGISSVSWDAVTGKPEIFNPYRLPLVARPCGTNDTTTVPGSHMVGSQNAALSGWLNTTGSDPDGYAFKYNIATDSTLAGLFPFPDAKLSFAHLEVNGMVYGPDEILINAAGIYWKDNALGFAPWPVDYDSPEDTGDAVNALSLVLEFAV